MTTMSIEDRALLRIERLPVSMALVEDDAGRRRLCALLKDSGLFNELSWPDARDVADAISMDAGRADGPESMRRRVRTVEIGRETWDDRTSVVWALTLAADVLDALAAGS